jgi:HlyD family secretion protein
MNAIIVQSVVIYDIIIEFANPDLKLFPGMTAYVTIPVATVENVLKVPNTALRYKPPMSSEEILAIYKQYGIENGERVQGGEVAAVPNPGSPLGSATTTPPRAPKADTAVVWKLLPDNTMEPVKVSLGITDHAFTEVTAILKGELKEGADLIIRSVVAKGQTLGGIRR